MALYVLFLVECFKYVNQSFTYSTGFKQNEKLTPTITQRTVLKYFAIFKNVAHSLEPGETPCYSASYQDPNYAQRS